MNGRDTPRLARFAWSVLAYNVAVVVWGAYVRASESGAGCGAHWPLCKGHFLPSLADAATRIELTHRVTSALDGLLVVALLVVTWRVRERGDPTRRAAAFSVAFVVAEGLLGAGLVLLGYVARDSSVGRAVWMAMHLVNTLLLLGALSLTAFHASGGAAFPLRASGLRNALAIALGAALLAAAFGSQAALADTLFPARTLVEGLTADARAGHVLLTLRLAHPVVAMLCAVVVFAIAGVASALRPTPAVRAASWAVGLSLILQLALGFVNVGLLAPVWMQLWHLANADVLWISLVLLAASSLAAPVPAEPPPVGA